MEKTGRPRRREGKVAADQPEPEEFPDQDNLVAGQMTDQIVRQFYRNQPETKPKPEKR